MCNALFTTVHGFRCLFAQFAISWFHYWLCQNHPLSFLTKCEQRNDLENSHRVCWWGVRLYLESHCIQSFQTEVSFLWLSKFSVLWWLLLVKAEQMTHEHTPGFPCWLIKLSLAISNSWEPPAGWGCSGQWLKLLNRGPAPFQIVYPIPSTLHRCTCHICQPHANTLDILGHELVPGTHA